jgi:hypothetical protein
MQLTATAAADLCGRHKAILQFFLLTTNGFHAVECCCGCAAIAQQRQPLNEKQRQQRRRGECTVGCPIARTFHPTTTAANHLHQPRLTAGSTPSAPTKAAETGPPNSPKQPQIFPACPFSPIRNYFPNNRIFTIFGIKIHHFCIYYFVAFLTSMSILYL